MTRRLVMPAAAIVFMAAATAGATISMLLRAPAEIALAAASGNVTVFWHALLTAFADALRAVLAYL
jgi:hypothetical protein